MVFIVKRLEIRPVSRRVGAFPEVLSVADSRSKSRRAGVNQGLDGD